MLRTWGADVIVGFTPPLLHGGELRENGTPFLGGLWMETTVYWAILWTC